uniref:Uncharacterized protein n=1 Tax=Panagrolaimus sp. PS1159 TaxID=55785 RepID=A0AC35G8E5_9BILA
MDHDARYCPDRFNVLQMFIPNIDDDLMPRFLKLLKSDEKDFLVFSYPFLHFSVPSKLKKVIHQKEICFPGLTANIQILSNFDLVAADNVKIQHDFWIAQTVGLSSLKHVTFHVKHLEICSSPVLSEEVLKLLSHRTKTFKCGEIKFQPKLKLCEIKKKAPNLDFIDISKTDIELNISWPNLYQERKGLFYKWRFNVNFYLKKEQ